MTRPDRVSGLVLYRTSKVGREPQGESLARGSSGARAECGGVLRKRTKFCEAKTVVTFNASAPRQSNLGSFYMKKDWFIPVFFSCSSQRLGLEATVRVQRERAEAGAVCDCVENTEANRVMPLNASEQDNLGSFLLRNKCRLLPVFVLSVKSRV